MIGVLEVYDRSHVLRGNASQDAPRPLSNATQSNGRYQCQARQTVYRIPLRPRSAVLMLLHSVGKLRTAEPQQP